MTKITKDQLLKLANHIFRTELINVIEDYLDSSEDLFKISNSDESADAYYENYDYLLKLLKPK